MGEIITAQDIDRAREIKAQIIPPSNSPTPASGLGELNNGLKDIKELADTINGILDKVQALRNAKASLAGQTTGNVIKSAPAQISQATPQAQAVVEVAKKIDRTKLRAVLENALTNQAKMIPKDIQEKKLGEILGDNFKTFEYEFLGQKFNGETILVILTNTFADVVDGINEAK